MAASENQSNVFDQSDTYRTLALEVEGRKFWVPRDTMAAHSPVFKEMLFGKFSEANKDVIPLPGKKAKDIEEVLRCLIPMPVCKEIERSNVETILAFADEYQAADLRNRAEVFMASIIPMPACKEIDISDLEMILKFADEYQLKEVRNRAEVFVASMLEKCPKSDPQLLNILPIAVNYRMKILKACLDRCVDEIRLGKLLPILKDVPDQVKAYLAFGQLAASALEERRRGGNSRYTPRPSAGPCPECEVWDLVRCTICGEYCCSTCNPCNCEAKMDELKKALLDGM